MNKNKKVEQDVNII